MKLATLSWGFMRPSKSERFITVTCLNFYSLFLGRDNIWLQTTPPAISSKNIPFHWQSTNNCVALLQSHPRMELFKRTRALLLNLGSQNHLKHHLQLLDVPQPDQTIVCRYWMPSMLIYFRLLLLFTISLSNVYCIVEPASVWVWVLKHGLQAVQHTCMPCLHWNHEKERWNYCTPFVFYHGFLLCGFTVNLTSNLLCETGTGTLHVCSQQWTWWLE